MRIRIIIYALLVAFTLDMSVYGGHYFRMALQTAQYGGDQVAAEVDYWILKPIRRTVPNFLPPHT